MNRNFYLSIFLMTIILVVALATRFVGLTQFPPSLYWEEVALGYDAYSLLQTGRDHHGHAWPLVAFESFGDWKPSGYFYAAMPFISVLGLSEIAARLPSVVAGVSIVIGVGALFWLGWEWVYQDKKTLRSIKMPERNAWSMVAMGVAALSPWAIQFSRAAWEVNLATAWLVWGVVCFMLGFRNQSKKSWGFVLLSCVLFIFSAYTYHATRFIAVALVGLLLLLSTVPPSITLDGKTILSWLVTLRQQLVKIAVAVVVMGVAITPLFLAARSPQLSVRLQQTSKYTDLTPLQRSNDLRIMAGDTLVARVLFHRYVLYGSEILHNFFSHFTLSFLFISGDNFPRHSIQSVGELYLFELPFLLLGIYFSIKRFNRWFIFLYFWLVIALIPASVTLASPHALRILPSLPVFMILLTYGLREFVAQGVSVAKRIRIPQLPATLCISIFISSGYAFSFGYFWLNYSRIYPQLHQNQWQYGYEEMISALSVFEKQYPDHKVYISREKGRPAMYYWFYTKIDPRSIQAVDATAKKDLGEFLEFENKEFVAEPFLIHQEQKIVVASGMDFYERLMEQKQVIPEVLTTIPGLDGEPQWILYRL